MKGKLIVAALSLSLVMATGCTRKVIVASPATRVEVIPVAPSPRHIWVKGHYVRKGRKEVWVPGYYVIPGRGGRYR